MNRNRKRGNGITVAELMPQWESSKRKRPTAGDLFLKLSAVAAVQNGLVAGEEARAKAKPAAPPKPPPKPPAKPKRAAG